MREYLIYCTYCNEYTALGKYVDGEGRFQGEYSLLHNRHMQSDELLCRFLLRHIGHHLKTLPNRTDEYSDVLKHAERYMERDIDKFMEMSLERKAKLADEQTMDRELGQLQLHVLQSILRDEAGRISKLPAANAAESQFMLGREEGLKQALRLLDELMDKTNLYYK